MRTKAKHIALGIFAALVIVCVLAFIVWVYIVSYVGVHGGI